MAPDFGYRGLNLPLQHLYFRPIPAHRAKDTVPLWSDVTAVENPAADRAAAYALKSNLIDGNASYTLLHVRLWNGRAKAKGPA